MEELPAVPPTEIYEKAFKQLKASGKLHRGDMAMLQAQLFSPGTQITARELAQAARYKNHAAGNLQYGLLGKKLRLALSYFGHTIDGGQESYSLSFLVAPRYSGESEWLFEMHEPVAQALRELGWFPE